MKIEEQNLNETQKLPIKSIHYWVTREMEEVQDILDMIPRDYQFPDDILQDKRMEIMHSFHDIKKGLLFLNKHAHDKMVLNKK